METYAHFFDKHDKKMVDALDDIQGAQKGDFKGENFEFSFWKPSTGLTGHGGQAYG